MPRKRGRKIAKKPKGERFEVEERAIILGKVLAKRPYQEIEAQHNCSKDFLIDIQKKWNETGTVKDRRRSGRPPKTTEREDRHMELTVARHPKTNATHMAQRLVPGFCKKSVSRWTVARRLRARGFKAYVAKRKPLLSEANIKKRLAWAKVHADWTVEDWKKVCFSDETPFSLFQSYGRKIVWRRPGEQYKDDCLEKTVKHGGGKIQVWGCFTYYGAGPLYWVKGIMNGPKYREILKRQMAPHMKDIDEKEGIKLTFQHDNDPKHKSKVVKNYLENKKFTVLDWCSQSPDINPIENGWRKVKVNICHREEKAKNLEHLFEIAQEEWNNLPLSFFQGLIESMPRRVQAVLKARGGHTRY